LAAKRRPGRLARWTARLKAWWSPPAPPQTERQQARALIAAIDAGGVPMIPRRVNEIARGLGLEVSSRAPVEQTIERIRAALARAEP
jgi:hypothetical protein